MIFSPANEWRAITFTSPHKIINVGYDKNICFLRQAIFGASQKNFAFETRRKADTGTKKFVFIMKFDFSVCFYFAQLFAFFSALSIIFFGKFQKKWLLIHWLQIMCTSWLVVQRANIVKLVWRLYNERNFAFSLIFPSFGSANKCGLGNSWQIVDFMFNFEHFWFLDRLSIKRTSP